MQEQPKDDQPELESESWDEFDPRTGQTVKVVRQRRGLFAKESRHYDQLHPALASTATPRELIENLCNELRDTLEANNLPSDRVFYWIKIEEEDWKPCREEKELPEKDFKIVPWYSVVDELKAPLSCQRAAARLLKEMQAVLNAGKFTEHQLLFLMSAMHAFADYRILRKYNAPAHEGMRSREGRRKGPQIRKEKSAQVRAVILNHARRYWDVHPAYRGQVQMTAEAIADDVHQELRAQNLLPKNKTRLSISTIAAHLRASSCG